MNVYWRFKGEKAWRYGYQTDAQAGLWRMGHWNGDTSGGTLVSPEEIEIKKWS
jgi:hypothetical protein